MAPEKILSLLEALVERAEANARTLHPTSNSVGDCVTVAAARWLKKEAAYVKECERLQTLLGGGTLVVGGLEKKWFAQAEPQPFRDDEPVTPEMVERLGWCKQKWGRDASCVSFVSPLASDGRTTLRWRSSFGHQGWRIASSGVADSYAITPVTTFGQLAALCRGLGIPCEVKDE